MTVPSDVRKMSPSGGPRAGQIMKPVGGTLSRDTSIADAGDRMRTGGVDCLPVLANKKVVGVVSCWDVARAIEHQLGGAPVEMIMTTPLPLVRPDTSWKRMYRLMIRARIGHLPVVDPGGLAGMVSQSDLLRQGPSDDAVSTGDGVAAGEEKNLAETMKKRYAPRIFSFLRRAGQLGRERGEEVYLVGGSVRDLLLATPDMDMDLAVVGDGMAFAHAFVDSHGGRVVCYRRFGTALMVLPRGLKIDVVSARWEKYRHPGALPAVEPGALVHDLYRRDFTINSMAIQLSGDRFGRLMDPFEGRRDLTGKSIEVMHNLSFVEDPTRMIRAVRFEGRYGFRMSPRTRHLLRAAAAAGMLDRVSGQRLREELLILLREPRPLPAIRRLQQMGILESLHPALKLTPKLAGVLARARRHILHWQDLWPADELEGWVVYLIGLFSRLPFSEAQRLAERLVLHRRVLDSLRLAHRFDREIITVLSDSRKPANSVLYQILHPCPPEVLVYFMALAPGKAAASRVNHYRRRLHDVRLDIQGEDLKKMGLAPGAIYQRVLQGVLMAKLDGHAAGRQDQLHLARQLSQRDS